MNTFSQRQPTNDQRFITHAQSSTSSRFKQIFLSDKSSDESIRPFAILDSFSKRTSQQIK